MTTSIEQFEERYQILEPIGDGGSATTYRGIDSADGSEVAIKQLELAEAADWKAIELFERESSALQGLDHPAVPSYIDAVHDEAGGRFILVQEFIDGEPLQRKIDRGEIMVDEELEDFLRQLLGILDYLHGLSPPVIHRDIEPSNIIVDGGHYALVDFGAVQVVVDDEQGGSTVVGSTGYMPPEQLMGRATPASDLYSLAATAVHLATGCAPSQMPMERMKLQFRDLIPFSAPIVDVLERMLEPEVDDRFESATAVIEALDDPRSVGSSAVARSDSDMSVAPVPNPISEVHRNGDALVIDIDAGPSRNRLEMSVVPAVIAAFMGVGATGVGCLLESALMCCTGSSLLFLGMPLALFFGPQFLHRKDERLVISPQGVELMFRESEDGDDGDNFSVRHSIALPELKQCYLGDRGGSGVSFERKGVVFVDSANKIATFGARSRLHGHVLDAGVPSPAEAEWLYEIIQDHLQELSDD